MRRRRRRRRREEEEGGGEEVIKMYIHIHMQYRDSCQILMKL